MPDLSRNRFHGRLLACVLLLCATLATAQQSKPAKDDKSATAFKEQLVVPEGTPEEKFEYFERLKQQRPRFATDAEMRSHAQRVYETIAAASSKLLASKLTPEQESKLTASYFEALVILNRLEDPRAKAPMLAMAEKLKDHKDRELADYARMQLLQQHMDAVMTGAPGSAPKLLEAGKAYLAAGKPSGERLDAMRTIARGLEMAGHYPEALAAYEALRETFHKSGNLDLMAAVEDTVKAARARLGAIGKKVEIESTTLDGKPFDIASLNGKVVLVDFWATWCGPCIRELPNIKKNYEKYHERGFEVVGISLDQDRAALEGFLRDTELPWTTLFSDNTAATQKLADRFGVEGIPAMLLVGRDGKVITLKARGEDLGKELERLLGDTNAAPAEKK